MAENASLFDKSYRVISKLVEQIKRIDKENRGSNVSRDLDCKRQRSEIENYSAVLPEDNEEIKRVAECPFCQHSGSFDLIIEEHSVYILNGDNEGRKSKYADVSAVQCSNCSEIIFDDDSK